MDDSRNSSSDNHHSSYSSSPTKDIHHRQNQNYQRHNEHASSSSDNNEIERATLSRQDSDISLYDQYSLPPEFIDQSDKRTNNIINTSPWTRKQWQALEDWYVKMDRDCQRATNAYFINESIVSDSTTPVWSRDYILWRCQCLDTNTKFHSGILPSERKRLKDRLKNITKQHDLLRPRRNGIEHHLQQQAQKIQQRQQKKKKKQKNDTCNVDHKSYNDNDTVITTDDGGT